MTLKTDAALPKLFGLTDDLKATIVTSLAALMSRTNADVEANAGLSLDHIENMGRKLDEVRNASKTEDMSFFQKMKGGTQEIDGRTFFETIGLIDSGIDMTKESLMRVLESSTREDADSVGRAVIFLGLAVNAGIELIAGKALPLPATYWADFYSETMESWNPNNK